MNRLETLDFDFNDKKSFQKLESVMDKYAEFQKAYHRAHSTTANYVTFADEDENEIEMEMPQQSTAIGGTGEYRIFITSTPCERLNDLLTDYVNNQDKNYSADGVL